MKKSLRTLLICAAISTLPAFSQQHPPGMLGVALDEVVAEQVTALSLPGEYGAWVKAVGPESPAAKAGIMDNDVIVSYNGQRVESARALQRMVLETPAGRSVELRLIRDGKAALVQPTLGVGQMPTYSAAAPRAPKSLGVGIENIAPAVGQYLGLKDGVGVIVRAIKENSPASEAGILEKDILVSINDVGITSAEQMAAELKKSTSYSATINLIRGTELQTLEVQL
ncbi:PDZ domain-containing protein [Kiritimatiellota bacterium B12222]|nr:PDZ domain-containing protein [Kiritimatiellota bacterium B12222]